MQSRVRNDSPKIVFHVKREPFGILARSVFLTSEIEELSKVQVCIIFSAAIKVKLFFKHSYKPALFRRDVMVKYCLHRAKQMVFLRVAMYHVF